MPQTPLGYRRRNTLRHKEFDYTRAGAYFVTFCIQDGHCAFGKVVNQTMVYNPLGQIAVQAWTTIIKRRPTTRLDEYIIMPNHVHALIWLLAQPTDTMLAQPSQTRQFGDAIAGSLSTLIGSYKSSVTQTAKTQGLIPDTSLWQNNFYDHIVRSEQDLHHIRDYIRTNPARWLEDQLHPNAPPNQFNRTWRP
jgi:putative transposase